VSADGDLVAATLTPPQQDAVRFYQALNVPASWFIGTTTDDFGRVEVLALGAGFVWTFLIDTDGLAQASEATVGEFSTGIDV
jgi:hypothetical protein